MGDPESDAQDSRPKGASPEIASDQSLLRRFRSGQQEASTQLYLKYAHRLYALALSRSSAELARMVDPEDIVQSVFRTFFRRAAKGHYDVPEGAEIWKLLLVIALNKLRAAAVHHHAAKRDLRRVASGEGFDLALDDRPGGDEVALTVLRLVVEQVLEGLPAAHRRIVELRIEGFGIAEIAEKVERSRRTVERVVQEFRDRLDALIHRDG